MPTSSDQSHLATYTRKFTKLKQGGTRYGKAPHKPIFLLTLIELIDNRIVIDNCVVITPELVATFKENFSLLVKTTHKDDFTQPFFYLQSDGFWFLKPKAGYSIDTHIRSVQTLSDRLDFGYFADGLYDLLRNDYARLALRNTLLNYYFSDTKAEFLRVKNAGRSYVNDLEAYLLSEKTSPYALLQPTDDEEIRFVRGGLFKRLVPKVYDFTCAISGMKVISVDGSSLVEACHIVPISISGDDKVTNGIALCPNLHTAFDKGMIGINEQLRVVVSPSLADNVASPYNLKQFHGRSIRLPFSEMHYPKIESFRGICRNDLRSSWRIN
ncbi:HNH endonuclease [Spirosoma harenae]